PGASMARQVVAIATSANHGVRPFTIIVLLDKQNWEKDACATSAEKARSDSTFAPGIHDPGYTQLEPVGVVRWHPCDSSPLLLSLLDLTVKAGTGRFPT